MRSGAHQRTSLVSVSNVDSQLTELKNLPTLGHAALSAQPSVTLRLQTKSEVGSGPDLPLDSLPSKSIITCEGHYPGNPELSQSISRSDDLISTTLTLP